MPGQAWRISKSTGLLELTECQQLDCTRPPPPVDECGGEARLVFIDALSDAETGDHIAMINVALCYLWGIGVARNLALALAWERALDGCCGTVAGQLSGDSDESASESCEDPRLRVGIPPSVSERIDTLEPVTNCHERL